MFNICFAFYKHDHQASKLFIITFNYRPILDLWRWCLFQCCSCQPRIGILSKSHELLTRTQRISHKELIALPWQNFCCHLKCLRFSMKQPIGFKLSGITIDDGELPLQIRIREENKYIDTCKIFNILYIQVIYFVMK